MQKILFRLGWGTMVAGGIFLSYIVIFYFSFRSDINFLLKKQDVVFNIFWRTAFYLHITGGLLCILTGPFQFIKRLREKNRKLHRTIGKIYLTGILVLAGPSGLFMAFYAEGGWVAALGFTLMAMLWLLATWKAYESVRNGKIEAHKRWMVRSYAMTFAAVTLRLWVPFASLGLDLDPDLIDMMSAYISWIPNLIVAEVILKFFGRSL